MPGHDADAAPLWQRLLWMLLLWGAGVAAVSVVAMLLRCWLR